MGNASGHHDARLHQMVAAGSWDRAERFFQSAGLGEKMANLRYLHGRAPSSGEVDHAPVLISAIARGAPIGLLREMILIGGRDVAAMRDSRGNTALHVACQVESPAPIVHLLMDVGGRELVGARCGRGFTALSLVCNAGLGIKVKVGSRLVPVKKQSRLDGRSVVEIVDRMVELGGEGLVRGRDAQNQTALMYGAKAPSVPEEALIRLIRAGGKKLLMMRNNKHMTALHIALWKGDAPGKPPDGRTFKTGAIREMIEVGGADLVNARGHLGVTALHAACSFGAPPRVIGWLVDAGTGTGLLTTTTDEKGGMSMTALRFALRPGDGICPETVRILARAGGRELVLSRGGDGRTALDVLSSPGGGARDASPNRKEAARILEEVLMKGSDGDEEDERRDAGMDRVAAVAVPLSTSSAESFNDATIASARMI